MKKTGKNIVTVIRRSCLTGRVVWIYRGASIESARRAYMRACKKEVVRVRTWMMQQNERICSISKFISCCMSSLPLSAEMTQEQKEAAKELQRIKKEEHICHREFYDHIIEETRRKNEASMRWRESRNEWIGRLV